MGLKLHPIIQRKPLDDPLVLEVLQDFAGHKKTVLTHVGVSQYYLGDEKGLNHPGNGKIAKIEELVRTFPASGKAGAKTSEAKPLNRQRVEHCHLLSLIIAPEKTTKVTSR